MTDDTHPAVETVLTGRPRGEVDDWRDRAAVTAVGPDARPGALVPDDETRTAAVRGAVNLAVLDAAVGDGGAVVADGRAGVGGRDEVPGIPRAVRDLADGTAVAMAVDGVPDDWRDRLPGWRATEALTGIDLAADPGEVFEGHRDSANVGRGAFVKTVRDVAVTDALAARIADAGDRRNLDDLRADVGRGVLDTASETATGQVTGVIKRLMEAGHVGLDGGDLHGAGKAYETGLTEAAEGVASEGAEHDSGGRTAGR